MKKCPKCNWQNKDEAQECANCGFSLEIVKPIEKTAEEQIGEAISTIAIFTAPIINNVKDYLGTVSYEVIFGTNFFKDLTASITDFVGGRSGTYECVFKDAKTECINKVKKQCYDMGGNAIVNLKIEFLSISESRMLMCYVSGTAVTI